MIDPLPDADPITGLGTADVSAALQANAAAAIAQFAEMATEVFRAFRPALIHFAFTVWPPTPWHFKRARVNLRRAGQPVTCEAVRALARRYRIEGRTP